MTTTVEALEQAVENLSPDELKEFRRWFAEYDAKIWDKQIEADAAAGKFDALAAEALAEYEAGEAQEIEHSAHESAAEKKYGYGSLAGQVIMSDDFDEPLEDLKAYM